MADAKQRGKALPEGMWNSGALTVNKDNIDEIIARQKDAAARAGLLQGRGRQAARRPATSTSADAHGQAACSRPRASRKTYGGVVALAGADFTVRAGIGARAAGRERRRQVDAGEDHRRRAAPRRRDGARSTARRSASPPPPRPSATASRSSRRSSTCSRTSTCSPNLFPMRELTPRAVRRPRRDGRSARGRCSPSSASTCRCARRSASSALAERQLRRDRQGAADRRRAC